MRKTALVFALALWLASAAQAQNPGQYITYPNGVPTSANAPTVGIAPDELVGAANIATGQVSCTTSATPVVPARTGVAGTGRVSATITNTTGTTIYLGGPTVTAATGDVLPGVVGSFKTFNVTAAVYCVTASGTVKVTFNEKY